MTDAPTDEQQMLKAIDALVKIWPSLRFIPIPELAIIPVKRMGLITENLNTIHTMIEQLRTIGMTYGAVEAAVHDILLENEER